MAANRIKGITIEIGGDTTKLVSALSSVDNAIKNTQSNLRDIDKALKFDPSNVALLTEKQKAMADQIDQTKERVEKEKAALEELNKKLDEPWDLDHAEEFQKNAKAAEDLKLQIELDQAAVNQLEKDYKEFGSVGKQQMQAVADKMKEVGDKIKEVGDGITNMGKGLTQKVTAPIVAGLTAAVKVTADFDSQMSKVQAISGATGDEFSQLRDKARELGAETKYSATEVGQGFEYMAMAGWKTEAMLEGIDGILNLAAASGEELGTTSDIVTDALTAFGMTAEESGRLADILAAAATNANTNVSMMGESFKYVAPVAGSLGYSAEDVAVALGLMANSGIKADMAGTSLRNMFQRLAKPTKESYNAMVALGLSIADSEGNAYTFREIMDQIRTSFAGVNVDLEMYNKSLDAYDEALAKGEVSQEQYDTMVKQLNVDLLGTAGSEKARYAAMLGGTRAMSGLLAIANATDEDYQKLMASIDGSSDTFARLQDGSVVPLTEALANGQQVMETYNGSAEAMAKTMQDNLGGDLTTLSSMLQELAISIGDILMPTLRDVVSSVQDIVTWLNSLDEDTKKTIVNVALVVAAIGPALVAIGSLVSAIGTIVGAISAAIPVITALGATTLLTIGWIAAVVVAIAALGVAIYQNWDTIKEWCQGAWEKIKEMTQNVIQAITKLKDDFVARWNEIKTNVVNTVDNIKTTAVNTFNNIKTSVTNTVNNLKNGVVNTFNNIKTGITTAVNNIKNGVTTTFNNIKSGITSTVGGIKDNIIKGFEGAVNYIKNLPKQALQWGKDIINNLIQGIKDKISGITDAIGSVADIISDFIHFSEPEKGPLKDFHTFMPDMMSQIARGITQGIPQIEQAMRGLTETMVPTLEVPAAQASNNYNNSIQLTVYGSPGQDVNQLAQVIQDKINNQISSNRAVFS